jgi:polar amino acid transport system substrate-binding protein
VSIGFIGAGSYAQSYLLPNIPRDRDVALKGVMTMTSTSARSAGERFGFEFCTSNEAEILQNQEINTVFIATRHDSHARYVMKALEEGKNVFVEKPLCLTQEELDEVKQSYERSLASLASPPILMVGYNRRFSPLAEMMKENVASGPMAMIYRVNAGAIPRETWIQDTEMGGGRIIGEVCHFVDFLTFINGSAPNSLYATVMRAAEHLNDTLNVSLTYHNGSIGTICYFANGNKRLPKERVEICAHGITGVLDDFKSLAIYGNGSPKTKHLFSRNKGQKNQIRSFLDAIRTGSSLPIPFPDIYNTSLITFKILESLRYGKKVEV